MLQLLYFFQPVDKLGHAQEQIALPEVVNTVAALLARLGQNDEKYRVALSDAN